MKQHKTSERTLFLVMAIATLFLAFSSFGGWISHLYENDDVTTAVQG